MERKKARERKGEGAKGRKGEGAKGRKKAMERLSDKRRYAFWFCVQGWKISVIIRFNQRYLCSNKKARERKGERGRERKGENGEGAIG